MPTTIKLLATTLALTLCFACDKAPTAPPPVVPRVVVSDAAQVVKELVEGEPIHGLPVSLVIPGYEQQVGYLCATQPREYCSPDGACVKETDYYVVLDRCPLVSIE